MYLDQTVSVIHNSICYSNELLNSPLVLGRYSFLLNISEIAPCKQNKGLGQEYQQFQYIMKNLDFDQLSFTKIPKLYQQLLIKHANTEIAFDLMLKQLGRIQTVQDMFEI
ncbi:Hypothetical_protein [Hexamita inflata]|uniref:Hypothetical_protein n=1 Tax=Hexamita inflata TaxID=28002 RepID=A0AA86NJI8_9EUKA|nr:Hypothetical protein HINF_LOCUS8847 [Hexamita inflata]